MSTAAIKQFVQFFKEFLDLCLCSDWPASDANEEDIIKALQVAHHVELAVKKMKSERNCLTEFLDLLCIDRNFTDTFLNNCISDPPKFILKKIINSDPSYDLVNIAFKRFQHLYPKDRLEGAVSELMVEAASKETLLKDCRTTLPGHKMQELYNHLYLFAILECDSKEIIVETLKDCCPKIMDTLVLCLLSDNLVELKSNVLESVRSKIINGFTNVMICQDTSAKNFWELLLNVDKDNLVKMCLKYKALANMIFDALGERAKQIKNNFPSESSYIQITNSKLQSILSTIYTNELLKKNFLKNIRENGYESYLPEM